MNIKPIETQYKGYRFRSRLEARWAVFFDALDIQWEYEKEGYYLGELGWYLPDFWLPQVSMWAEVKPGPFSRDELDKCDTLTRVTGFGCVLLDGVPKAQNYYTTTFYDEPDGVGGYGPDDLRSDVVMGEGHYYHLSESRFYGCSGDSWPIRTDWSQCPDLARAVEAARSARFEHGESPR